MKLSKNNVKIKKILNFIFIMKLWKNDEIDLLYYEEKYDYNFNNICYYINYN